jgi:hypothetical protein
MASGIDHIVLAVADPDAAVAELERVVGLTCTGGGRHEGLGTANRIAFLADGSYVELMAVEDEDEAGGWPMGAATLRALGQSRGLAAWALEDDNLPITVASLRAAGSSIGPISPAARRRADGEIVRWWTAVAEPLAADGLPFLIRHARYGPEWGPAAVAARAGIPHPAGSPVVLRGLDLAVADPHRLAAVQRDELGIEYRLVVDAAVAPVGRHVIRLVAATSGAPQVSVRLTVSGAARRVEALGAEWILAR